MEIIYFNSVWHGYRRIYHADNISHSKYREVIMTEILFHGESKEAEIKKMENIIEKCVEGIIPEQNINAEDAAKAIRLVAV
jgi:hypothetical protein